MDHSENIRQEEEINSYKRLFNDLSITEETNTEILPNSGEGFLTIDPDANPTS